MATRGLGGDVTRGVGGNRDRGISVTRGLGGSNRTGFFQNPLMMNHGPGTRNRVSGPLMRTMHALSAPGYVLGNILQGRPQDALIIGATLGQASKYRLPVSRVSWVKAALPGGTPGALLGLGLDIATDPLTYLTLGTGAAARAGTTVALRSGTRTAGMKALPRGTTYGELKAMQDALAAKTDDLIRSRTADGAAGRLTAEEAADAAAEMAWLRANEPRAFTVGLRVPFGRGRFGRGQSVTFLQGNRTPSQVLRDNNMEGIGDLLARPGQMYQKLALSPGQADKVRQLGNWTHAGGGMNPTLRAMEQELRRQRAVEDAITNDGLRAFTKELRTVSKQLGRNYKHVSENLTYHLEDPVQHPLIAVGKSGVYDEDAAERLAFLADTARTFFRKVRDEEVSAGIDVPMRDNYVPHMLRMGPDQEQSMRGFAVKRAAGERGARASWMEHREPDATLDKLVEYARNSGQKVELDLPRIMQLRAQDSRRKIHTKVVGDVTAGTPGVPTSYRAPLVDTARAESELAQARTAWDEARGGLAASADTTDPMIRNYIAARADYLAEQRQWRYLSRRFRAAPEGSDERRLLRDMIRENADKRSRVLAAFNRSKRLLQEKGFTDAQIDERLAQIGDEGASYGVAANRPGLTRGPLTKRANETLEQRRDRIAREILDEDRSDLEIQIAKREERIAQLEKLIDTPDEQIQESILAGQKQKANLYKREMRDLIRFLDDLNVRDREELARINAARPTPSKAEPAPLAAEAQDVLVTKTVSPETRQRIARNRRDRRRNMEARIEGMSRRKAAEYKRSWEAKEAERVAKEDELLEAYVKSVPPDEIPLGVDLGKAMPDNRGEIPTQARTEASSVRGKRDMEQYFTPQYENLTRKASRQENVFWKRKSEQKVMELEATLALKQKELADRASWSPEERMIMEKDIDQIARELELEKILRDTPFDGGLGFAGRQALSEAQEASRTLTNAEKKLSAFELINKRILARRGEAVTEEQFDLARDQYGQIPETFKFQGSTEADWAATQGLVRDARTQDIIGVTQPRANKIDAKTAQDLREMYDRINPTITDNMAWNALVTVTSHWKALALLSFGYHVRNQLDDGLRAYWGGARSPLSYWQAMQTVLRKGDSDDIIDLGKHGKMTVRELWQIAKGRGVVGTGQINADILSESGRAVGKKTIADRMPGRGAVSRVSQGFGNKREDSMRLFFFIEMLKRGENTDTAAKLTRDWLFDYGDVGKFVESSRRFFLPFVTYPSKALPQTIKTFASKPGIPANMLKVVDFFEVQANLSPQDLANLPSFLEDAFIIPDMTGMGFLIGGDDDEPYVLDPSKVMGASSIGYLDPRWDQIRANLAGTWSPLINSGLTMIAGYDPFLDRKYGEDARVYAPAAIQGLNRIGVPIANYGPKTDQFRDEQFPGYSYRLNALLNLLPVFGQQSRALPSGREDSWKTGAFKFFTGLPVTPYDRANAAFWAERNRR